MPEAPPRLKRNDFQSDELFQAATAQRELESRERRKWSEWLRDQRRDRTGRARPSEDARRLTPVAKRAKSEANKAARDERSKERRTVYEADRRARIEAREAPRRAARVEMWARITARQTDERAAFLAKAATRVTERRSVKLLQQYVRRTRLHSQNSTNQPPNGGLKLANLSNSGARVLIN